MDAPGRKTAHGSPTLERKIGAETAARLHPGGKERMAVEGARQAGKPFAIGGFLKRRFGARTVPGFIPEPGSEGMFGGGLGADSVISGAEARFPGKRVSERAPADDLILESPDGCCGAFTAVGWMPEAVESYLSSEDVPAAGIAQEEAVAGCRSDVGKRYEERERNKAFACFESIPAQLAGGIGNSDTRR